MRIRNRPPLADAPQVPRPSPSAPDRVRATAVTAAATLFGACAATSSYQPAAWLTFFAALPFTSGPYGLVTALQVAAVGGFIGAGGVGVFAALVGAKVGAALVPRRDETS